jgi:glycosyltransferase involved in cell wall biosynthesis
MAITLSIVMPAHNEYDNLWGAVSHVREEIEKFPGITDWEIIIVDSVNRDGSHDGTPELADEIATIDPNVRVVHNREYVNLGYKYHQGLKAARFEYYMMVPGENTLHGDSLSNLLDQVGKSDLVVGYIGNPERRPWKRRIISKLFVIVMSGLFQLRLRYYNGTTIIRTADLRALDFQVDDFAYMAVILVLLLARFSRSYHQVPIYIRGRRIHGQSKAFRWDNIKGVATTVARLWWHVFVG